MVWMAAMAAMAETGAQDETGNRTVYGLMALPFRLRRSVNWDKMAKMGLEAIAPLVPPNPRMCATTCKPPTVVMVAMAAMGDQAVGVAMSRFTTPTQRNCDRCW